MATIRDGMKIGLGFLLFKWLLGLFGFVLIGGFVLCSMVNEDSNKKIAATRTRSPPKRKAKQRQKAESVPTVAVYPKGCIVRRGPSTKQPKIGFAKAGQRYTVTNRHGRWLQVNGEGQFGWCGCRTK